MYEKIQMHDTVLSVLQLWDLLIYQITAIYAALYIYDVPS